MSKNNEIIFLEPIFKEMVWGSNNLKAKYGFNSPFEQTGEAWVVSSHEDGDCVISNTMQKGKSLSWLWSTHPELFGNLESNKFPLLIKFIDAKDDLSVQVHPDNKYAFTNENGSKGKKECWYVVDCDKDATIIVGHNASSREEIIQHINDDKWSIILNEFPIKPGDFFLINPGTIHAIKGGTIILETQQSSNITYRLYDYGRVVNGKHRELHIEKALDVIDYRKEKKTQTSNFYKCSDGVTQLVSCPEFIVEKYTVSDNLKFEQDKNFICCTVVKGHGKINNHGINTGDAFILPYKFGNVEIKGSVEILASYIT